MPKIELVEKIKDQAAQLEQKDVYAFLQEIIKLMGPNVVHANSFGPEDLVIMHMLHEIDPKFKSFSLDTGRLNPETYELMGRLKDDYQLALEVLFPQRETVEAMVKEKGINLFYESVESRKLCCQVRKVEPLGRVLSRYSGWICGLRKEQSPTRTSILKVEVDEAHGGMIKFNPLADWKQAQVWDYIKKNSIPYNRLHDKNYLSIGCAPCTRAVQQGESERSGRWWWEDPDTKECGLHVKE